MASRPDITDFRRWAEISNLNDESWVSRAKEVSHYIPDYSKVLDLGCGAMHLKQFLPQHCQYIGSDLFPRDGNTIICNYNHGEMPPNDQYDSISLLGVLEYIYEPRIFLRKLVPYRADIIMTYSISDGMSCAYRESLGWVNHFTLHEVLQIITDAGFKLESVDFLHQSRVIIKASQQEPRLTQALPDFSKTRKIIAFPFGDSCTHETQLGKRMIRYLLPSESQLTFGTLSNDLEGLSEFDLIVLGVGDFVTGPMDMEYLFRLLDLGKPTIGFFGTCYRDLLDQSRFKELISSLLLWGAMHREDILAFGKGSKNAFHIGNWSILPPGLQSSGPSDRENFGGQKTATNGIQKIDGHHAVFSDIFWDFLTTLEYAEAVSYLDERKHGHDLPSGKFNSFLLDAFSRSFSENQWYVINRAKLEEYKLYVKRNYEILKTNMSSTNY